MFGFRVKGIAVRGARCVERGAGWRSGVRGARFAFRVAGYAVRGKHHAVQVMGFGFRGTNLG